VLVGYYNSQEQYNMDSTDTAFTISEWAQVSGSLILDKETVSAKYLLLHTSGDKISGDLWKILSKGPKIYSKNDLIEMGYPSPTQDNYLILQVEPVTDPEFREINWDFRNLKNFAAGRASALPFTANLAELMRNRVVL
jgi:hypothetical protein